MSTEFALKSSPEGEDLDRGAFVCKDQKHPHPMRSTAPQDVAVAKCFPLRGGRQAEAFKCQLFKQPAALGLLAVNNPQS